MKWNISISMLSQLKEYLGKSTLARALILGSALSFSPMATANDGIGNDMPNGSTENRAIEHTTTIQTDAEGLERQVESNFPLYASNDIVPLPTYNQLLPSSSYSAGPTYDRPREPSPGELKNNYIAGTALVVGGCLLGYYALTHKGEENVELYFIGGLALTVWGLTFF
jgi:hypothetical protein